MVRVGETRPRLVSDLAASRATGTTCETEAYVNVLVREVQSVLTLDRGYKRGLEVEKRLAADPNVQTALSKDLAYRLVLAGIHYGSPQKIDAVVSELFKGVTLFSRNGGAMGPAYEITLNGDGTALRRSPSDVAADGKLIYTEKKGFWRLEMAKLGNDNMLILVTNFGVRERHVMTGIAAEGEMRFIDVKNFSKWQKNPQEAWFDNDMVSSPTDCDV